ncbi:MAG: VWA domain-containing protein [Myxococcota bacterium]
MIGRSGLGSLLVGGLLAAGLGCADASVHQRAVYMLLDTSGTYSAELAKAEAIARYLLGSLSSGDSLGLARIDSASFSEKDIIAKVSFDDRPSRANQQKRAFRSRLDAFVRHVRGARHTDITGGILQAAEWLNETGAGQKFILVFSDLEEDLRAGYVRDFAIDLEGIHVVAINVTKLRGDQVDPREYRKRLAGWEKRVTAGGGDWRVLNNLERLDKLLES